MASSPQFAQVLRAVDALRTVGLIWDSNHFEEQLGGGIHIIDFKDRNREVVPQYLAEIYLSVREAWKGVNALDDYIRRDVERQYTVKFIDSAVASFQCTYQDGTLIKQHASYQQSPFFRSYSDEDLYDCIDHPAGIGFEAYWQLFGIQKPCVTELVSFRCDYDPAVFKLKSHPKAHLHLANSESCRVCAMSPVDAKTFFLFIISHFYCRKLAEFEDILGDWDGYSRFEQCIHDEELNSPFLSWGKL